MTVIDYEEKKNGARLMLRKRRIEAASKGRTEEIKTPLEAFMQWLGGRSALGSLFVSLTLVLLIIVTVNSIVGIVSATIVSAAVLFYITRKEGNPAIKECFMLLLWGGVAFFFNQFYPIENLKMPLGIILSGMMIASLFYVYKTSHKRDEHQRSGSGVT